MPDEMQLGISNTHAKKLNESRTLFAVCTGTIKLLIFVSH